MTKNASKFDFDGLDTRAACEMPYEFELNHPVTKAPLGVFISVIGSESQAISNRFRKAENDKRRKAFEAQRKPGSDAPKMLEEDEADTVSLTVDLVKGWRTVIDGKSEPVIHWKEEKLDFNADNARRWLTHFPWVRLQVIEEATEVGNFLKN